MTNVKTSQKEMAQTIKWHPRKKINRLMYIFSMVHLKSREVVPFFLLIKHCACTLI